MAETASDKCQRMTQAALESNIVQHIVKGMEKLGCETPREFFTCKPCAPNESIIGGFVPDSDDPKVVVCEDNVDKFQIGQLHVNRTVAHELVHAFDHCRAKVDWKDCFHVACTEVRAARLSGDCDMDAELKRRNFDVAGQGKVCARRRAELSVANHPQCAEIAQQVVAKVLDSCYEDQAPFLKR